MVKKWITSSLRCYTAPFDCCENADRNPITPDLIFYAEPETLLGIIDKSPRG